MNFRQIVFIAAIVGFAVMWVRRNEPVPLSPEVRDLLGDKVDETASATGVQGFPAKYPMWGFVADQRVGTPRWY